LRRDVRLHDHAALTAACTECDEVIPLFVFDEPLLASQTFGAACVNFMLGCLADVAASLAERGAVLRYRRGDPLDVVVQAARDWRVDAVYWNRDYEPRAVARDRRVQQVLTQAGVAARTFKDHVLFEVDEIRGSTGEPLQRYSAYRARWWTKWHAEKPIPLPVPRAIRGPKADSETLPSPRELGYESVLPWIPAGEAAAQQRLQEFLDGALQRYADGRNRPGLDGTSKLSAHFRFGTLSPKTAVHAAWTRLMKGGAVSRADVLTWIDELVWREFFQQVLAAFPHVAEEPFRRSAVPPARTAGSEHDRLYKAWCEGRTGFPIVDAGMRQLKTTGWMHNRVRMITASFLIKDLRIDWQSGERYFMRQLLDADVAANNGNWQWCAATGTDAMRGYRIFNPALQSKKFDKDGVYIRRYVPELAAVPARWIHEPHLMPPAEQARAGCRLGVEYPFPIVDHGQARQEYLHLAKQEAVR
jgi:deoxyribodipyrimidine photo-lyase